MRLALAVLLAGLAAPALADDFPKLKPGLWEMERSATSQPQQPGRMTICFDESMQKEMFDMGAGQMQEMCSKHEFKFSGNRGTGDFVCKMDGSTMRSKSTTVLTGDTGYRTEVHTTYDPPFMGQKESTMVLTGRHVGACKPGQRPGDMMINGQTINMRDAMGGAGAAPKGNAPARTRPKADRQPG